MMEIPPRATSTHPSEVEMRLVVAANAVVDDLELLGGLDGHASHVLYAFAHRRHVLVLVFLEPRAFADSIIRNLQGAGLVILHCGALELQTNGKSPLFQEFPQSRRALKKTTEENQRYIYIYIYFCLSGGDEGIFAQDTFAHVVRVYLP